MNNLNATPKTGSNVIHIQKQLVAKERKLERLSLQDFFSKLMDIPPHTLTLDVFKEMVAQIEWDREFLEKHILYRPDKKYGWTPVLQTEYVEILTCQWYPGQQSGIHDHQWSLNVTQVLKGTLTAQLYEISEQELVLSHEEKLNQGEITGVERHPQYHQLLNREAEELLVTLHFYCPARK